MWAVSLVFASFLIGLGGKVVGELPGVERRLRVEGFLEPGALARLESSSDSLTRRSRTQAAERERAQLSLTAAENSYTSARDAFANWVNTRAVTTDPTQDPEVVQRTRQLDELGAVVRRAQENVEVLDAELLAISQQMQTDQVERDALYDEASSRFERALFWQELKVFGIRLALTVPLLVIAGWLVARKRKSDYWPLLRGFVLFALFAFFVELVPYLPSYGGYIRYSVGIAASIITGVYVIRAMRRYLARRQAVALQTEAERRNALPYEEALKRMGANVCPGCERSLASASLGAASVAGAGSGSGSNFCVHCGMMLYDHCGACETRKNAFFQFCPACGVTATAA